MRRIATILGLVIMLCQPPVGAAAVKIEGLGRPVGLDVDQNQLYIIENAAVHIFSLKDFSRTAIFGKRGQGPGEFHTYPHVHITLDCSTERLIIGSVRKISYYSKQGDLLSEKTARNLALKLVVLDATTGRERFLGWSQRVIEGVTHNTIVVFDQALTKVCELYRARDPFQGRGRGYDMLPKTFSFLAHRDRILVPGEDDASVAVLDRDLNPCLSIRVDREPLRVSEEFKRRMIDDLRSHPETKDVYPMLLPLRFPTHFPVIQTYSADGGKLYVMT